MNPTPKRVLAGFAAAVVVLAVVFLVGYFSIRELIAASSDTSRTQAVMNELQGLLAALGDVETASRGYVIAGTASFKAPYEHGLASLPGHLAAARHLTADDAEQQRGLDELERLVARKVAFVQLVLAARDREGAAAAGRLVSTAVGQSEMDAIRRQAGEMLTRERTRLTRRHEAAASTARSTYYFLLAGTVTSFGLWFVAFLVMRRELTLRTAAEGQLASAHAELQAVLDSATQVAIIATDRQGNVTLFSPGAEKIFGHSRTDAVGRNVSFLMPEPYRSKHDGFVRRYLETGIRRALGLTLEVVGQRKDGTAVPLDLTLSEVRLGEVHRFTAIMRDITERKEMERLKSEFVSTVSHELRTPLTSIRGSLGLLAGGAAGEVPARAKPLVDIALRNCERLVRLINDILDIEKLEAGKMVFDVRPLELMPLIDQAVEANRAYASHLGVSLGVEASVPRARVTVDPDRLSQVLTNLISNAAKFSPPQATVSIAVRRLEATLRVSVRDRGPGIPVEFRSRIFQRFAQADSSDTKQKGGTGLGLAICRTIIERLGGRIGFDTAGGQGTEFFFELPEAPASDPAEAALAPSCPLPGRGGRSALDLPMVLYVEDDPSIFAVTSALLSGICQVVQAGTVRDARQCLQERAFDLILLDLALPDGSGAGLIPLVRSLAPPPVPIVVFSAHDMDPAAARDVTAVLVKSRTSEHELVGTIHSLLAKRAGCTVLTDPSVDVT
ncbi:MAG: CHASE3 domain-containing protein [Candidatus Riflebacteria bacterium]|nr:CHASE3 domain-containing protein [Candidatus Riflebacteria bacterium]